MSERASDIHIEPRRDVGVVRFRIDGVLHQVYTIPTPVLIAMTSADAFPYTVNPIKPKHDQYILRGKRAQFAHHDPRPCLMPPDWSKGYTSIFSLQQEEEAEIAR